MGLRPRVGERLHEIDAGHPESIQVAHEVDSVLIPGRGAIEGSSGFWPWARVRVRATNSRIAILSSPLSGLIECPA